LRWRLGRSILRYYPERVEAKKRDTARAAPSVGVAELAAKHISVGVANPPAGVFSKGTVGLAAVVLSLFVVSFPLGGVLPADGDP
jgi:hypothetical protein